MSLLDRMLAEYHDDDALRALEVVTEVVPTPRHVLEDLADEAWFIADVLLMDLDTVSSVASGNPSHGRRKDT